MKNLLPSSRSSLLIAGLLAVLTACGGGGGSALIGGTITGLRSGLTLVMQNDAADDFTITGNGANSYTFNFATALGANTAYVVTVKTQPLGQTCALTNASGTTDSNGDNVNSVQVSCSQTSSVVASVSGLSAGAFVNLSLNGSTTPTTVTANGSVGLPGILSTGSVYTVAITQQPAGQTCTLTNATGTIAANTTSVVTVNCS